MKLIEKSTKIISAALVSAFCLNVNTVQAVTQGTTSPKTDTSEKSGNVNRPGTPENKIASGNKTKPENKASQGQPGQAIEDHSQQLSEERIDRERADAERQARAQPVADALTAVEQSQEAAKAIQDNNIPKANSALENAIGKIDVLLAKNPEMKRVPVSAQVQIFDFIADEDTLKGIVKHAKDYLNDGEVQATRKVLRNFASEIDIITISIPLATYRPAIQSAARLLSEGKTQAAKMALVQALNSLVIVERSIPIPLLRAQAWIDEVNRQVTENKINLPESDKLLDDASMQLKIARVMGYGIRDNEVDQLQSSIKQLHKDLNDKKDSKALLARIKTDLNTVKERMMKSPENEKNPEKK